MDEDPYTMGAVGNGDIWEWKRDDELMVVVYADGSTRPYNDEELAARQARITFAEAQVELEREEQDREVLRAAVKAVVAELATYDAAAAALIGLPNATINGNPAAYIKDLARGSRKIMGLVADLAKLL